MIGLTFYILFFSIVTSAVSAPAWVIGKRRHLLFLMDGLSLFYGYLVSFLLVAFSLSTQSFTSFFWELFIISIFYLLMIYIRVFLLKTIESSKLISWVMLGFLIIVTVFVSLFMPHLAE